MLGGVDEVGGGRIPKCHLLARSKPVRDNYPAQLLLEMIHLCNSSDTLICTLFEGEDWKFLLREILVGGKQKKKRKDRKGKREGIGRGWRNISFSIARVVRERTE